MRHASAYEDCLSSAMTDISSDKAVFARPIAVLRRRDTAIGERIPRHATRYAAAYLGRGSPSTGGICEIWTASKTRRQPLHTSLRFRGLERSHESAQQARSSFSD